MSEVAGHPISKFQKELCPGIHKSLHALSVQQFLLLTTEIPRLPECADEGLGAVTQSVGIVILLYM